ncbi:MAG: hypothetical protein M3N93_15280 [Acidobacteriota bacterium]|nr:hypothetical protein [Acidobacteriota bacterium]
MPSITQPVQTAGTPPPVKALPVKSWVLLAGTLAVGGLFKAAAFARETFIASKFGLSNLTDAYFGLQQLPLALATFMFGAFALAFAPAYAGARRDAAHIEWLPGLVFYGCLAGVLLTGVTMVSAPILLGIFNQPGSYGRPTLVILSVCYAPIVFIGIWSAISTATGRNIAALTLTGLPYLLMTLVLLALYLSGALNGLSLPISMSAGFGLVGVYGLVRILMTLRGPFDWTSIVAPWKSPACRGFLRQLSASSIENVGFSGNQLLLVYFIARTGVGAVSANNCAMRIGMLGYSILAQPLGQLVQSRLCVTDHRDSYVVFRKWLIRSMVLITGVALGLYVLRVDIVRAVYLRGQFTTSDLGAVSAILPAWIGYFIVMSLNSFAARYLFHASRGVEYVQRMIAAYVGANALRIAIGSHWGPPSIVWCSVAAESVALIITLRSVLSMEQSVKSVALNRQMSNRQI